MAESIVTVYSKHRHSCFLYLTSILVDEIGEHYSLDLQNLFQLLAQPTLEQLDQADGLRICIFDDILNDIRNIVYTSYVY